MDEQELKDRTKRFGLCVADVVESLPSTRVADVFGRQLLRAATSVGANYRAACRAKSPADFISKMGTVEEEADESMFWLEMILARKLVAEAQAHPLLREADELTSIAVASFRTARRRL